MPRPGQGLGGCRRPRSVRPLAEGGGNSLQRRRLLSEQDWGSRLWREGNARAAWSGSVLRSEQPRLDSRGWQCEENSPTLLSPGPHRWLQANEAGWFLQQTKSFTVDIRAKPEYHKFLIGKGGGKIRKVRDSTGARIVFPAAEDREQDLITIIGKEDAVREAQRELEALIQNLVSQVGGAGPAWSRQAGGQGLTQQPS